MLGAVKKVCGLALGMLALAPPGHAGAVLGVDVQNYIVMYEGGSSGAQLSINNFGTTGIWTGDIGIAGVGKLAASGPGTLNGNINFAAPNTGQASISNTTIIGTVNYGVAPVQTIMNNLNTLSSTLGAQAAMGAVLAINTSSDQTVLASSGTNEGSYRLFSVTSVSTGNGENLIVKGDGSQNVVFDVNTPSDAQFHGNILLQDLAGKFFGDAGYAGLTPDQVLFNLYAGAALVGGDKLDANDNGNLAHPANIITADFLDPNGAISVVNTRITGRIFGGDSVNMQIVSGDTISLPPSPPVDAPEPGSLALLGAALAVLGLIRRPRAPHECALPASATSAGPCRSRSDG
jgi:hypothetical protein